jgi:hypothetical protein
MAKFKKGDRVRCVVDECGYGVLGRTGRVTGISEVNPFLYDVKMGLRTLLFWGRELAPNPQTVAPKNRSRVDAGPSWGVAFPVGAE